MAAHFGRPPFSRQNQPHKPQEPVQAVAEAPKKVQADTEKPTQEPETPLGSHGGAPGKVR